MVQWPHDDYARLSSEALKESIVATIARCPLITAWNNPKIKGAVNGLGFASLSRYETIKPDYDFIDLGALARNIAHELTLWSQVESAQDAIRAA
jgi:hypothetical protein